MKDIIFLAHASEDKYVVRKIHDHLKDEGLNPWLDEINLLPGMKWDMEIRRAIKKARIFLAFLSKNSINKDGYVQRELKLALTVLEEKPEGLIYFIPVMLDESDVPELTIGTINLVDYQSVKIHENNLREFVRYLSSLIDSNQSPQSWNLGKMKPNEIHELVKNGEIRKSIDSLLEKTRNTEKFDNVTMVSAQFERLIKDYRLGVISNQDYSVQSNRIISAILDLASN